MIFHNLPTIKPDWRRMIALCLLFLLSLVYTALPAQADEKGMFTFADWDGPPIKVYYIEPENLAADAPIIIVMHGVKRNAHDYRDHWTMLARQYGFAVYVPKFDRYHFPKAKSYNLGGLTKDKNRAIDAFEPLFATLKKRRNTNQKRYYLFGHSAGAQFVHRFVFFKPDAKIAMALAANAGWYTMPNKQAKWPYGLSGLPSDIYDINMIVNRPLVVLLGQNDIRQDKSLRTTPQAMAQGPHRLQRGISFLKAAQASADALNLPLHWRFKIVPNIGHEGDKMAKIAASLVAQDHQKKQKLENQE